MGGALAVDESALGDRLFHRQLARPVIGAGERMAAQHQELKDQDREAEGVVVWRPDHPPKSRQVLELRRLVRHDPDLAGEPLAVQRDLEAIAVDERDRGVRCDQDVPLVDVANNLALGVDDAKGAGEIGRDVDEKAPVGSRKLAEPRARPVEVVNRALPGNPG